jgi:hypothetical protein
VDLSDLIEEVPSGVGGEDVGEARVHAHPEQGQAARTLPGVRQLELIVSQLHPGQLEGPLGGGGGWGTGQARSRVDVVHARLQGALEHGHHEGRVDRVHGQVHRVAPREPGDGGRVRRVDTRGGRSGRAVR